MGTGYSLGKDIHSQCYKIPLSVWMWWCGGHHAMHPTYKRCVEGLVSNKFMTIMLTVIPITIDTHVWQASAAHAYMYINE